MRALVYTGPSTVELLDVDEPVPGPDEVVVDVAASGICGSELHGVRTPGYRVPPLVMGHEFAGCTPDGERVVVNPILSCSRCDLCGTGAPHLCRHRCILGIHRAGGFGERVAVPRDALLALPDDVSWEQAALIEPLANGIHAWRLAAGRGWEPKRVGVIGAGAIGLFCVVAARASAPDVEVSVAELSPERRSVVAAMGVDAGEALTGEFDVVFDAVGAPTTRRASVDVLRPGGCAVWLGLFSDDAGFRALELVRGERAVFGSFAYTPEDFADAVEQVRAVPAEWAANVPLGDGATMFRELMDGRTDVVKAVLRP